jgi:uncharacterized membrane protein YhaH (DUF805 family)
MWAEVQDSGYYKMLRYMVRYVIRFKGRATRRELFVILGFTFVSFVLIFGTLGTLPSGLDEDTNLFINLVGLILFFVPILGVFVRRLHDTGRDAGGLWALLIPYVGWFIFASVMIIAGNKGENDYGPDPRAHCK